MIGTKTSFEKMKSDKDVKVADFLMVQPSTFFRSGTNNSWKEMFTKEQEQEIDQMLNHLKDTLKWDVNFE